MNGRVFSALVTITACCRHPAVYAQFTDPRTYTVVPVGLNVLELDYGHAEADASLDTSLEVVGAHFTQNEGAVSCTHNFGMLGHLGWVKVNVPFASVSGSVAGTNTSGSTTGFGDSSLQLTALLSGGRALSAAELETYEPSTSLALSLTVSAPTGEYDANKLLNLGSHRWSFKPEFGVSHPFGPERRWEIDGYVNVEFFTDNTAYHGVEILRQEPLPGVEGHLSYDFTHSLWASLDLRYSFRGDTVVDGVSQNDAQELLTAGTEVSWSPSASHSLVIIFAKALVYRNAPAETRVALKYVYSWGARSE